MTMSKEQQDALEVLEGIYKGHADEIKSAKPGDEIALLSTVALISPSGLTNAGMHVCDRFGALMNAASQCVVKLILDAPEEEQERALLTAMVLISETVKRKRAGDGRPVTSADIDRAKGLILIPEDRCPDTKLH